MPLGDKAANPAVVSWMASPVQVLHLPIAVAVIVFPVLGFVMVMGPSQGDSSGGSKKATGMLAKKAVWLPGPQYASAGSANWVSAPVKFPGWGHCVQARAVTARKAIVRRLVSCILLGL